MPARTSKEVTDRQKSCLFVLAALKRQGPRVAELLLGQSLPNLEEGDEEPGFLSSIVAISRNLKVSLARLVAADETAYAANTNLDTLRVQRNGLHKALTRQIERLRFSLLGQYFAPNLERIGIERPIARSPYPLVRQADRIAASFQSDELGELLGEPVFDSPLDLSEHVEKIVTTARELSSKLQQIDDGLRAVQEAVVVKNTTMGEHDQLFLHSSRTFEALCRLAGETELADRVRPSARRPGRRAQEVKEPKDLQTESPKESVSQSLSS